MVKYCDSCGEEIPHEYVKAGEQTFHPRHFRCELCEQQIEGKYVDERDGVYHVDCFERANLPECDICGDSLRGRYLSDFWDHTFCNKHETEFERCPYCHTLIAPGLKQQVVEYGDGRIVCGTCADRSIDSVPEANRICEAIVSCLSDYGIGVDYSEVDLELVSKDTLKERMDEFKEGLTQCETTYQGDELAEMNLSVSILYGLPGFRFRKVAAHELMHVWIYQATDLRDVSGSALKYIEGSCEFASYLIMSDLDDEYTELNIEEFKRNEDEIYGEGFDEILAFVDEHGIKEWLARLREGRIRF